MIRPLIIAPYLFRNDPVGIIEIEFINALIDADIYPTVICKFLDNNIEDKFAGKCNIIKIKENRLFFYLEKIFRHIHLNDLILTPDYDRYSWNRRAYKSAIKQAKFNKFDYVHTISFPSSSHLIGYRIKKKTHIPFVAQFYDPWVGNPIRNIRSNFFKKYDIKLEGKIAEAADIIIHTNKGIVEEWDSRYGDTVESKQYVLPLINSLIPTNRNNSEKQFIINHIGTLYNGRTAQPFIEAINIIKNTRPELLKKIQSNFVGGMPSSDLNLVNKYNLNEIIRNVGRKSTEDCKKYYESASMFLAIDCSYKYDYFYPSKILKYFSSQRPILGIVNGDTVLKSELDLSKNYPISMSDHRGIASFLINCLDGNINLNDFDHEYYKRFLPSYVSKEYCKIISKILPIKQK